MHLYEIDPLADPRWIELVARSEASSVFHTPQWLDALQRTYRYSPVVFTDSAPGEPLRNGLVFCRVNSRLTGNRLVSLPFSDHCEPLIESPVALTAMLQSLAVLATDDRARYVELRPLTPIDVAGFGSSAVFCSHALDLRPTEAKIFAGFHKSCVQRSIRRAERAGLECEVGRSDPLIRDFYALLALTRRKHRVPPQPLAWFRNLVACLGDRLRIYVASQATTPVAAILTIVHKKALVYKYGGADARFNRFGAMPLLLWRAIRDGTREGLTRFDLGRSDTDNEGLLTFKDHFGAQRSALTYYRSPASSATAASAWWPAAARRVYARMPHVFQTTISGRLYRHFA